MAKNRLQKFLFPELNAKSMIRIAVVVISSLIVFKYILIPFRINGFSMMPTYKNESFNFCFTLRYLFTPPKPFDVVTIRFAGSQIMLLKRIIAKEGETVEFKEGYLHINGEKIDEEFVPTPGPRRCSEDHCPWDDLYRQEAGKCPQDQKGCRY